MLNTTGSSMTHWVFRVFSLIAAVKWSFKKLLLLAWVVAVLLGFNRLFFQPILCQLTKNNATGLIKNLSKVEVLIASYFISSWSGTIRPPSQWVLTVLVAFFLPWSWNRIPEWEIFLRTEIKLIDKKVSGHSRSFSRINIPISLFPVIGLILLVSLSDRDLLNFLLPLAQYRPEGLSSLCYSITALLCDRRQLREFFSIWQYISSLLVI